MQKLILSVRWRAARCSQPSSGCSGGFLGLQGLAEETLWLHQPRQPWELHPAHRAGAGVFAQAKAGSRAGSRPPSVASILLHPVTSSATVTPVSGSQRQDGEL